jgi:hypothetical protein
MTRRRPDPRQALFPFVWHDPGDDRDDDALDDAPQHSPPPLGARVRGRRAPRLARLWGDMAPVVPGKAPGCPPERSGGRRRPNR